MTVRPYGTGAVLVEGIDPALPPAWVDARLRAVPGVRDLLVADGTALLEFGDAPLVDPRPQLLAPAQPGEGRPLTEHLVRVRYDGPDLDTVAARVGLPRADVVERHAARVYEVQLVGFQPGFAYLGALDPVIDVPRLDRPRTRVPALSVAIAAGRTAIYPRAGPGGWNLVGTALDLEPFSTTRGALFRLGDRVRFVPVD